MNLDSFLNWIIDATYFEFLLIIFILFLLIFLGIDLHFRRKKIKKITQKLKTVLLEGIEKKEPFKLDSICSLKKYHFLILSILEDIDSKFSSDFWEKWKKDILSCCLLKKAEKYTFSLFWKKRLFAARAFSLSPSPSFEKNLLHLLKDPNSLVRLTSLKPAGFLATPKLLKAIIHTMKQQPEKSLYAYQDILLQSKENALLWMKEELIKEKDLDVIHIYLKILSKQNDPIVLKYILPDLQSQNPTIRLNAIKMLKAFPSAQVFNLLFPFLHDTNELVQAEIIKALPDLMGKEALEYLQPFLNNISPWLRLQAALSLKKLGKAGIRILENKTTKEPLAFETCQYALALQEELL
jgi:hypothetical protein